MKQAKIIVFPTRAELRADSERNNLAELNARLAGLPEAEPEAEAKLELTRFDVQDTATDRAIVALLACLIVYGMVLPFILTGIDTNRACMPPVNQTPQASN